MASKFSFAFREVIIIWASAIMAVGASKLFDNVVPSYRTGFYMSEEMHRAVDPVIGTLLWIGLMLILTLVTTWVCQQIVRALER